MKRIRLSAWALGILVAGALFVSCNKSNFENDNPDVAGLMAFNLAPGKTVAAGISGNLITNTPLAFNNYTGAYLSIYPGDRLVEYYDYSTGDSLASASFDFEVKKYYSSFLVGSGSSYQNVIVLDDFDSLSASSGQSYVRYINAIPGSASPAVTISAGGTNVVNENAVFASVSDFVAVPAGSVTIAVNEGSINASRTITTEGKKVYTVLLIAGATDTEPAQIKYVTNGMLEDEAGQRVSSSTHPVSMK